MPILVDEIFRQMFFNSHNIRQHFEDGTFGAAIRKGENEANDIASIGVNRNVLCANLLQLDF